ncbi:bifunctional hydroxymethylpyrimidine kinase/phosphomethylpyrimidine kinase [Echinicola jeungdonensis]|nr:bifunctional hydroxymethylpyrimidine kinase/phosphomethylpyrimidine kinase [Echinicola jeungdonensis]MDN3668323.1 bifunctional hydroxymethylpyrimidine kinase/phosphomethylpyrimidine kinase [Echinicola jeungdonensis]
MNTQYQYIKLLTIAGSDSGGGAGIQADLKTFSALGCYGMSVITAVTSQNTCGVRNILGVQGNHVASQLDAVLEDLPPRAIKIGMLHRPEIVEIVSEKLQALNETPIVFDPVMVSTSGDPLITLETVELLKEKLFPLCDLVTPNLDEAETLEGFPVRNKKDMEEVGKRILHYGSKAVLVKGGHLEGNQVFDVLCQRGGKITIFKGEKISTSNSHGTGCTLSSAIASFLAQGKNLEEAVREGREYVRNALESGKEIRTGKGKGPLNHFFSPIEMKKVTES